MILSQVAGDPPALAPLLVVLISGLSGAVVTALVALFGAWLNSRREHKRWLREQRFEAYVRTWDVMQRYRGAKYEARLWSENADTTTVLDRLRSRVVLDREIQSLQELLPEVVAVEASLEILGPDKVYCAAIAMRDAFAAGTLETGQPEMAKFVKLAREQLKIR